MGLNLNEKKEEEKNQMITNHLSKRNFIKHATYKVDLPLKIASFVYVTIPRGWQYETTKFRRRSSDS